MSSLNAESKTIEEFIGGRKNLFFIPDYQRPYSWEDEECETLWNDIFAFAFPDDDCSKFNSDDDEYFLGSLVVFKNDNNQIEVIDGQQRLITLTLLLRAFYQAFGDNMNDEDSHDIKRDIAKCLWKMSERDKNPDMNEIKIFSDVAAENEAKDFANIMLAGEADKNSKTRYALNYRLFQKKIKEFHEEYPSYFSMMPDRILSNCSMLPIETESQETALRIFATLNDRGKPLSDSDIFKAKLYNAYSKHNQKDLFISRWRDFENTCAKILVTGKSNPVDDIFMRYMFYARASKNIRDTTTPKLRDFYSLDNDKFSLLARDYEQTFRNLMTLAEFWKDISVLDSARFSERVRKYLFILHYVPNNMWTFLTSVYFMTNKDSRGMLSEKKFFEFLTKITAFMIASRITRPGNTTPFFNAMADIAAGHHVAFKGYEFDIEQLRDAIRKFDFNDSRKITRSMIAWYIFQDELQEVLSLDQKFDTEHILPRKRERELINKANLESLGNKSFLERDINIRASDYRFSDKANYYLGNRGKASTKIHELSELAKTHKDFTEQDIEQRNNIIINRSTAS